MRTIRIPAVPARRGRARVLVTALAALLSACATTRTSTYTARSAAATAAAKSAVQNEARLSTTDIPENTISVSPLSVLATDTSYSSLGFGFASLLVNDLSRSAKLTLVERLRIDAVLRELDLVRTRRVDTNTAPRVGKLVGARRVVVGTLDLRGRGNLRLQSYVANTTTGKVGSSLDGSSTLNQIFDAEKSLAFRLFDVLGVVLTPAERRAVEAHATRSLVAFIEFSRGSRAEAFGDVAAAKTFYASALRLDPGFATARTALNALELPVIISLVPPDALRRATAVSNDLINRPLPVTVGSGADAPVTSGSKLITFTVVIRTP